MSNPIFRTNNFIQQNPLEAQFPFGQDNDNHSSTSTEAINVNIDRNSTSNSTISISPWRPNTRLRKLHNKFQNIILYQHICVPCVYCARLPYPTKAKWIPYNENITYPLQTYFPEIDLIFSGSTTQPKVSICSGCKTKPKHHLCPHLHHIPAEIESIPLMRRRFLSPVFLHCSLGRSAIHIRNIVNL